MAHGRGNAWRYSWSSKLRTQEETALSGYSHTSHGRGGGSEAVEELHETSAEKEECVSTVKAALRMLDRCCDPVAGAGRQLLSEGETVRLCGMQTLCDLPRVTLQDFDTSAAEVAGGSG